MKLQIKVLLFVVVILLVTGIISGGAMLYLHKTTSVAQFEQMATALASAVQGSLEQGMMLGNPQHIQEAMVRIGEENIVSETAIFSPDGVIEASSEISKIGQTTNNDEVRQVLQSGQATSLTNQQNGLTELQIITPIFNKAECQTCHSPGTTVLGAIQVSLDTASLDNQIRQQSVFFGTFGMLTLLIIGFGLTFALKRTVIAPLSTLAESAQSLSRGDYATRIQSNRGDEIGMLAQTFNEMAKSVEERSRELEASHQELARWNLDLESKIEQRTKELEEANKIGAQLLEKLISAQEEERRRIARELHDEASQSLGALALHLEDIAHTLPVRYNRTKQRLISLKEQARPCYQDIFQDFADR